MPAVKSTLFNVIVQKDGSWFVTRCIDNSVASQGKTIEEALDNLKKAIELYYEDEPYCNLPVPALLTSMEVSQRGSHRKLKNSSTPARTVIRPTYNEIACGTLRSDPGTSRN